MRVVEENNKFALIADSGKVINFGERYCHKLYRKTNDFSDCIEVDLSEMPAGDDAISDTEALEIITGGAV